MVLALCWVCKPLVSRICSQLVGPHNGATFCNIPRCIEQNVEWVTDLIAYMHRENLHQIEPTLEAEEAWTVHVDETAQHTLFPTAEFLVYGCQR